MSTPILESLGTTAPLADVFSDRSLIAAMLRFETTLARVEGDLGIIPAGAAGIIAAVEDPGAFDAAAISAGTPASGTPAIGFVAQLTSLVRAADAGAAGYVHLGTTSQDVTDTSLVLLLARARPILERDHDRLLRALRRLSDAHAGTVMAGRTLLQPATPTTLGLKAAGWYAASHRGWARVAGRFDEALVVQFGGASGTLAALGDRGLDVADRLARALGLGVPDAPWHAHRDRLAALLAACAVYVGSLGKMATDVSLLMQAEVAEAAEAGGGSSAMPQKRNPAQCARALAAATRVPGLLAGFLAGMLQAHERGAGGLHAELPAAAAIVQATGAALEAMAGVAEDLEVDPQRMRTNLDATRGGVYAEKAATLLAGTLGREAAHAIVGRAVTQAREGRTTLGEALAVMPEAAAVLTPEILATLEDPRGYLGVAERLRVRLLTGH